MIPDDNGVATSQLYLSKTHDDALRLDAWHALFPGQPEYNNLIYGKIEIDPWFSSVLRHAAEGCGFKASIKRVPSDWDESLCTCLSLSLDVPEAQTLSV